MAYNTNCQDCVQRHLEHRRWATKQAAKLVWWALATHEPAPIEEEDTTLYACYACEQAHDKMTPAELTEKEKAGIEAAFRDANRATLPADVFWRWLFNSPPEQNHRETSYNYADAVLKDQDRIKKEE